MFTLLILNGVKLKVINIDVSASIMLVLKTMKPSSLTCVSTEKQFQGMVQITDSSHLTTVSFDKN
jgi:hypothetical protein